jgi:ribosomal protein S27E
MTSKRWPVGDTGRTLEQHSGVTFDLQARLVRPDLEPPSSRRTDGRGTPVDDNLVIDLTDRGSADVPCPYCGAAVLLSTFTQWAGRPLTTTTCPSCLRTLTISTATWARWSNTADA